MAKSKKRENINTKHWQKSCKKTKSPMTWGGNIKWHSKTGKQLGNFL